MVKIIFFTRFYLNIEKGPTLADLWATEIHYVFVKGFGFFYLFTVLDAFSRYVIHWELRPTMTTDDAKAVILAAVRRAGIKPAHGLRLLNDNGSQFASRQFKRFLRDLQIRQVRTAYRHPETNGRLERYHLTLKDATERLELHTSPAAARAAIERFVYEYNTQRPHQALEYVTPASAHFGYADELRELRREIAKAQRIVENRRKSTQAAQRREGFPPSIPRRRVPLFGETCQNLLVLARVGRKTELSAKNGGSGSG